MKKLERAGKWAVDRLLTLLASEQTVPRSLDLSRVHRVLIVRPHNQLGDMLLATPFLTAVRRGFRGARISLVTSPENRQVMVSHPDIDELLLFDKKAFRKRPRLALRFLRAIRNPAWDLVIMPTTVSYSVTSALLAWLARATVRVGCNGEPYGRTIGRVIFHIHVPCEWDQEHQTERNLDFARAVGLSIPTRAPSLGLTAQERAWAREEIPDAGRSGVRSVGIHPGAGKPPNRWPVSKFAKVAAGMARTSGIRVYVMVGPKEHELRTAMRETLRPVNHRSAPHGDGDDARLDTNHGPVFLPDLTVRQAAALMERFELFLCNDTGVMHMAAALGTTTLALFGPTDPRQWAPLSPAVHWLRGEDGRVASLSADRVLEKCLELLLEKTYAARGDSRTEAS